MRVATGGMPRWSGPGRLAREEIPAIPDGIAALVHEVSTAGKLIESRNSLGSRG